uniref:Putative plant transposon protein domain-containing protein n=1 Tax=Solanum tuberosum TaxID=4113 RepID=M1BBA3_SOLTU
MVQGKTVNFAQEAIESVYNFPQFGGTAQDEYRTTYIKEPYKWDMFIEVICTSGQTVHWLKENHKFHSKSLNTEVKCWFHIITSRILPSTNTTEVHGFRAALFFFLMTKLRILPGLLIVEEMLDKATSPKYGYFFPAFITKLCRLSGVKFKKSDVTLMAGPKFRADRMTIGKTVRQPASTEEVGSDVDDVEELPDHVVPPTQSTQDSMGRSWAEQFHSLETQVDALHSSMADIHRKMNELTVKTGKSDRKILAWLRALGRTCTMDSSTVSDTD